ncbi:unnamed protein product [Ixodes pacificus]
MRLLCRRLTWSSSRSDSRQVFSVPASLFAFAATCVGHPIDGSSSDSWWFQEVESMVCWNSGTVPTIGEMGTIVGISARGPRTRRLRWVSCRTSVDCLQLAMSRVDASYSLRCGLVPRCRCAVLGSILKRVC